MQRLLNLKDVQEPDIIWSVQNSVFCEDLANVQQSTQTDGKSLAPLLDNDNSTTVSRLVTHYNLIQDEDFVISPNPSKDKLNIKFQSVNEDLNLEVFDVLGKLIYRGEITQLESSVNVSNWKSGVYLVRISNNKITHTKRFIKQ